MRESKHSIGTYGSGHSSGSVGMKFLLCFSSVPLWIVQSAAQGQFWRDWGDCVQMGLSRKRCRIQQQEMQPGLCFLAGAAQQIPWWLSSWKSAFWIQGTEMPFRTRQGSFLVICSQSRTLTHWISYSLNTNVIFLNVQSRDYTQGKLGGLAE